MDDDDVDVNGLLECNEILVVDIEMPAGWNFIKFQFISFSSKPFSVSKK